MRQLKQRGLTLIEVMVAFAIASMLALAAVPFFSDYGINSRLREAGNLLYGEALFAQSEAIKRNRTIRISTAGTTITVADASDAANPITLRTREMGNGVTTATGSINFSSTGWPTPLAAVSINLSHSTSTCDDDHRCPGLRVEAGGAIRLCGNKNSC
jgi:type IV fimbrial biogenesis protein FimT